MRRGPRVITYNFMEFWDRYKYLIAYLSGIIIGAVLINFFRRYYEVELVSYGKYLFGALSAKTTGAVPFLSILWQRLKEIVLCIIMTYTPFSKIYGAFLGFKYGICISIVISLAVACYNTIGLIIFMMSVLPYGIVLIIATYMMINILDDKDIGFRRLMPLCIVMILESILEFGF